MRDYYKELGLSRMATESQIKRAYRALCKKFHPDINTARGATSVLQQLNEAYTVLSDPEARAAYDLELRSLDLQIQAAAAPPTSSPPRPARPLRPRPAVREFACERCGAQDQTLGWVTVYSVFSVVETNRSAEMHIYCEPCRTRELVRHTVRTWVFGWWGLSGPRSTVRAVGANLTGAGAEKLAQRNAELRAAMRHGPGGMPPAGDAGWWTRFFTWRAHPACYSVPLMVLLLPVLLAIPVLTLASCGSLPFLFLLFFRKLLGRRA